MKLNFSFTEEEYLKLTEISNGFGISQSTILKVFIGKVSREQQLPEELNKMLDTTSVSNSYLSKEIIVEVSDEIGAGLESFCRELSITGIDLMRMYVCEVIKFKGVPFEVVEDPFYTISETRVSKY